MLPTTFVHGIIILMCQKVRHPCSRYILPSCIYLLATSPFLVSPPSPSPPLLSSPFPMSLLFFDLSISFNAKPVIRQYKKYSENQICKLGARPLKTSCLSLKHAWASVMGSMQHTRKEALGSFKVVVLVSAARNACEHSN